MNAKLTTPKIQPAEIEPIWANPKLEPFWRMWFLNLFFNSMPQEYQNEKSPILKGKKAQNTRESKKNAWEIYKIFANTLYITYARLLTCKWFAKHK